MALNVATASTPSIDDNHVESLDIKVVLPIREGLPTVTSSSLDDKNIFENPKLGKYFKPIDQYEGIHR